jgi:hypothetical protein
VEVKLHTGRLNEKQPEKICEEEDIINSVLLTTLWERDNGEDTRVLDLDAVLS